MFETKLTEDIRRKLSSINPNLKDEPHLLVKAYLSHKIKAKMKSFSNQVTVSQFVGLRAS